jgi:hypothetical protein
MRVLVTGPNMGLTLGDVGGNAILDAVVESLRALNAEVHIYAFCGSPRPGVGRSFQDYVFASTMPLPALPFLPIHIRRLQATLERLRPDVLIMQDDCVALRKGGFDVRIIVYSHFPYSVRAAMGVDFFKLSRRSIIARIAERYWLRLAWRRWIASPDSQQISGFISNSKVTASAVRRSFGLSTRVVPPPVTTNDICPIPVSRKQPWICSVGLHRGKEPELLIEALADDRIHGSASSLQLIGHATHRRIRELRRLAARAGVRDRVVISADLPRRDLVEIFQASKYVVSAASLEPFGVFLVEGMAAGCIPLARRTAFNGGATEILEGKQDVLTFEDEMDLVSRVVAIEKEPADTQQAISDWAIVRAQSYSKARFIETFAPIVSKICHRAEVGAL